MPMLVDATTAEHTRGIRTVSLGILDAFASGSWPESVVAAVGPETASLTRLPIRRVTMARTRPGRLVYQRLLLPYDVARLGEFDRVLALDAYAPLFRPSRGAHWAALIHDVLPLTHPEYWSTTKLVVKRAAFEALRRSGATVFTSTEYNAEQVHRTLGLEAKVVRFGCGQLTDDEADDARNGALPTRRPELVYVGAFEPRKGLFELLRSFEHLSKSRERELRLVLAGGGKSSHVHKLQQTIASMESRDRIQIVIDPDRSAALQLIKHAGALVFPAHAEGFGLPILEALALGTPVVATDLAAIRSWAGGSIRYAGSNKPTEWIEQVNGALNASEPSRRAGQTFAAVFRWSGAAATLSHF